LASPPAADLSSFRNREPTPETLTAFCERVREILRVDAVQLAGQDGKKVHRIAGAEPNPEVAENLLRTAAGPLVQAATPQVEASFDFAGRQVQLLASKTRRGDWLLVWARLSNPQAQALAREVIGLAGTVIPAPSTSEGGLGHLAEASSPRELGSRLAELSGGNAVYLARPGLLGLRFLTGGPDAPTPGGRLSRALQKAFRDSENKADCGEVARLTGNEKAVRVELEGGLIAVLAGPADMEPRATELQAAANLLTMRSGAGRLPRGKLLRISCIAAAILLLICLIPVPDRISSAVTLEPSIRRHVAAPFEALVEEITGERGDIVASGDVLVRLDGREINERTAEIQARLATAKLQSASNVEDARFSEALLRRLEAESLSHELEVLRERQKNLVMRSPIDGVVISGELDRARGAAVKLGQPLIEIAPLTPLIAQLAIVDRDVSLVKTGDPVKLRLDAFPNRTLTGDLDQILPRSESRDGENVFIGEVLLENENLDLRPGMQGRAVIIAPAKPLGWLLIRKPWSVLRSWLFR